MENNNANETRNEVTANPEKKFDIRELIEKGKAAGSLSQSEIMEAFEDTDYDIDQVEKLYEVLDGMGIEVTGYLDNPDFKAIESDVERYESAEDMEKMLAQEGLAIDDPVRMYLKEIGKVSLLNPDEETELAQKMSAGNLAAEQLESMEESSLSADELKQMKKII